MRPWVQKSNSDRCSARLGQMSARRDSIPKPMRRSPIRRSIGREFFIARRRISDARSDTDWATQSQQPDGFGHLISEHSSPIYRKLAGVARDLQTNKHTNLRLACQRLHGTAIGPGQTMSLWHAIGRPSQRRGFLEGMVLDQGSISSGTGGGLCQLSNILFWVAAHSPLKIVERHRHGFDVFPDAERNIPFGAGATVAFNYLDFRVTNPGEATFLIHVWVDDSHLNARLLSDTADPRSYEVIEADHRFDQQRWGGYSRHNRIIKRTLVVTEVIREEVLAINDALVRYSPMLEGG